MAEAIRRAEEGRIAMQTSIANLHQRIKALRERQQPQKQCGHSERGDNRHPPPSLKEGGEPVMQKRLVVQQAGQMPQPGCNDVPPGRIHPFQRPIPAHVRSGEPPCPPHSVPASGNGGTHSLECASTSGDHQEAPRVCQTLHRPVHMPLQPLVKPPLYTADCKWRTESPAAVRPAGVPFHMPEPHVWPLSFFPRGEGAACPMGHAPYSGDLQMVPRDFCLQHTSQPPHCRPPEKPLPFGTYNK